MRLACLLLLLGLPGTSVLACNIPVFRYALERWRPDAYEIVVFHDAPLLPDQERQVALLETVSVTSGGPANAEIRRARTTENTDKYLTELWREVQGQKGVALPYLVVRAKLARGRMVSCWQGMLDSVERAGLLDSPVRQELSKRLLAGDSVVWLLLKSSDKSQWQAARDLLAKEFASLTATLTLPDGIGLPGSELHSEVPLLLKFSVLELDSSDEKEAFLVNMLTGIHAPAFAAGEPMLIPVFGRGRALEVIPGSQTDADLIRNLTLFLCGACSCQVKEKNPGFDLLLSVDWNKQLFGDEGLAPPVSDSLSEGKSQVPVQLTIPPGKKSR